MIGFRSSLPIPTSMPTATCYGDLASPVPELARDLSSGRLSPNTPCHLDPDLDPLAFVDGRPTGWRGALGQVSAALSHLRNSDVGADDIFLFWGLFRTCERSLDRWRYAGPRVHAIFGWLQVGAVIDLGPDGSHLLTRFPWLERHPHVRPGWGGKNAIYLAREALGFGNRGVLGYGIFDRPIMPHAGWRRHDLPSQS